ncbi:transposase [Massilia cavernae]|uniref:Transposase n=2 Tax=Massilia cavernae TaxID=2320864 RepID=A0A418XQY4_9BURK|nr:transposase [Massilia cavernae]
MPRASQSQTGPLTRVLRLRLKDKHAAALREKSYWVNMVWNYCNDLSFKVWERERRFMSGYDFAKYTKGAGKAGIPLHSQTIQAISEEFAARRKQSKKLKLRWRVSEDARGRWYINISVKVGRPAASRMERSIGIDLGLKDFASTSDGEVIDAQHIYRDAEARLAAAQRAGKKKIVRNIHAKTANKRRDFNHKLSARLVVGHGAIFVGNVNAGALAKTRMAKSVSDAGWSQFRTMLSYKCDSAGVWFDEVHEAYSTQDCSACFARSGPKGLQDLGVREWTCLECGEHHHRDVNAAKNILRRGRATLVVGIPVL